MQTNAQYADRTKQPPTKIRTNITQKTQSEAKNGPDRNQNRPDDETQLEQRTTK